MGRGKAPLKCQLVIFRETPMTLLGTPVSVGEQAPEVAPATPAGARRAARRRHGDAGETAFIELLKEGEVRVRASEP